MMLTELTLTMGKHAMLFMFNRMELVRVMVDYVINHRSSIKRQRD